MEMWVNSKYLIEKKNFKKLEKKEYIKYGFL